MILAEHWIVLIKITSYIECSESDEVKEILTKIRKMHKKHFKDLLNSVE